MHFRQTAQLNSVCPLRSALSGRRTPGLFCWLWLSQMCCSSLLLAGCSAAGLDLDDRYSGTAAGDGLGGSGALPTGESAGDEDVAGEGAQNSGDSNEDAGDEVDGVCPGPDAFEDDDSFAEAKSLEFIEGKAQILAGIVSGDDDHFRLKLEHSDVVTVRGSYFVALSGADLAIDILDEQGTLVASDDRVRTSQFEDLAVNFKAGTVPSAYVLRVRARDAVACVAYEMAVDAAYCTDEGEDDDTQASAQALDHHVIAAVIGPDHEQGWPGDEDWYEFATRDADTTELRLEYAAGVDADPDFAVELTVFDRRGRQIAKAVEVEVDDRRSAIASWQPEGASATYWARVVSNAPICTDYRLTLGVCEDVFEDNDEPKDAVPLTAALQGARITAIDDDYYQLVDVPAAGACELHYTVASDSEQDLAMVLLDAQSNVIALDDAARVGLEETALVQWQAQDAPHTLGIWAQSDECVAYTVRCE